MMIQHGGRAFDVARERGWDWRDIADFSASINPLGPSPRVREAILGALDRIAFYPEAEPIELRRELARRWNVDERAVMLGNGATDLLHFFARVTRFEKVTLVVPTFSEFHRAWPDAATVPWDRPESWPGAVSDRGLLVLTRPNNPMGTVHALDNLPNATLLIDESFLDFTDAPSAIGTRDDIFVLRSLTKFHSLAGLRIGALVGRVEELRARREPWTVNVLASEAALAAVRDPAHEQASREYIARERRRLAAALGIEETPANYFFVPVPDSDALCAAMLERKVLLRNLRGTPGIAGDAVRLSVRTHEENSRLIEAWMECACVAF